MRQLVSSVKDRLEVLCARARGPIGLAVSGGGDSMALLRLALEWRASDAFIVFTVDHGLRPEAKAEAEFVSQTCRKLGLRHKCLEWAPQEGHISQALARKARHRLLANALRSHGGTHLLLGHTRDDQYETVHMWSKTGEMGFAGMRELSTSPVWPQGRGIFLARPLLALGRAPLRDFLSGVSQDWVEDPSNLDRKFERVRARQTLLSPDYGASEMARLKDKYLQAYQSRAEQDRRLLDWLERFVFAQEDGLIVCEPRDISVPDLAIALGFLTLFAGGTDRRAGFAPRLELASDILQSPKDWRSRTLGRAWLAPRKGLIHIARDPGLVDRSVSFATLDPGHIWDGRFEVMPHDQATKDSHFVSPEPPLSALARPSYPYALAEHGVVRCLVPARLDALKWILRHETCVYAC